MIVPLLSGLVSLLLGVFVLSRGRSQDANRAFFYWMVATGVWGLVEFGVGLVGVEGVGSVLHNLLGPSIGFTGATFLHFALAFTPPYSSLNLGLLRLLYGGSLGLLLLATAGITINTTLPLLFYHSVLLYGACLLLLRFRQTQNPLFRDALKYLLIGLGVSLMGGTLSAFGAIHGSISFPIANSILCMMAAWGIIRSNRWDMDAVFRRGVFYFVVSGVLSGLFFFGVVMFESVFFSSLIAGLVICVVSQPLREGLQALIDRLFLHRKYRIRRRLVDLSQEITAFIDRRDLLFTIIKGLEEVFGMERAIILLRKGERYTVSMSIGVDHLSRRTLWLGDGGSLVRYLEGSEGAILRTDAIRDPQIPKEVLEEIDRLDVELCIPITYGRRLLGILGIGEKASGRLYSPEEIGILLNLGREISLGLENTRLYEQMKENFFGIILALIKAIEAKDPYTWGHCERVAEYAVELAEELGLSHDIIQLIKTSGLLHDIGKVGIDEEILLKQGRLDDDEFAIIRAHPLIGSRILESIEFHSLIRDGVRHHHERVDGRGYPDGLLGKEIPLALKILSVVDVYEAMTSDRPYRKALSKEEAIRELRMGCGGQFDEGVVKRFIDILERERSITR